VQRKRHVRRRLNVPRRELPRAWPFWKAALFVLVAGFLLFAHGCHGDEDNELFARIIAAVVE
jgi:hypothetical protein